MSVQDLLDRLEELLGRLEDAEAFAELWERIRNLRDGITPDGPPDPSELWRLCGDILRKLAEEAPLPDAAKKLLSRIIDAIEATMESNVGLTLHTLCGRYFDWRRNGFSHEEAADQVSLDPLIRQWLLFKWLSGSCGKPDAPDAPDAPEPEADDPPSASPGPVIGVRTGPPWDFRDHECCAPPPAGRGGGAVPPTISASAPVWTAPPAGAGFAGKLLAISVIAKHPCGTGCTVHAWLRANGRSIRMERSPWDGRGGFRLRRRGEWNEATATADIELHATGEVVLIAVARSRCATRAMRQFRFTVP